MNLKCNQVSLQYCTLKLLHRLCFTPPPETLPCFPPLVSESHIGLLLPSYKTRFPSSCTIRYPPSTFQLFPDFPLKTPVAHCAFDLLSYKTRCRSPSCNINFHGAVPFPLVP